MAFGDEAQREQFVARFLAAEELCCQLFSEPGAGSDLGGLACRATRDGDEWVVNGQKVWSSGARFAEWGELIARSDPDVAKHKGLTAFIIPMDLPGIEIRPIRQMSGGASFNEVFFNDVRVPDSMRLGAVGEGWRVALTTLGFERDRSGQTADRAGRWQLAAAAGHRPGDGRHRRPDHPAAAGRRLHPRAHRDATSTGGSPTSSAPAAPPGPRARWASSCGPTA